MWTHEEILALIRISSDSAVQSRLDGASRTADIWGDVALSRPGSFADTGRGSEQRANEK